MVAVKYILRNLTVLNGILLAAVSGSIFWIILPFWNIPVSLPAGKIVPSAAGKTGAVAAPAMPSSGDYMLVSEQNLFHPERKIPPEKADEKSLPRPEVVLYGTVVAGDMSLAYIEDKKSPRSTPGRGKRQIAAPRGYNLNGYILEIIEPDHIVMVKGDDRITVRLEEGEKRRDGDMAKPVAAGITPVVQQPAQPAAAAVHPTEAPVQTIIGTQPGSSPTAFGMTGRRNAAQIQAIRRKQAGQTP